MTPHPWLAIEGNGGVLGAAENSHCRPLQLLKTRILGQRLTGWSSQVRPRNFETKETVVAKLEEVLQHRYVDSTWRHMVSIRERLRVYMEALRVDSVLDGALFFLTDLLLKEREKSSVLTYHWQLQKAIEIFDGMALKENWLWNAFGVCLRRMGALVPHRQAVAMTRDHFLRIVADNDIDINVRMAVLLAWKTGMRGSDLRRLNVGDVTVVAEEQAIIVHLVGNKTDYYVQGTHIWADVGSPEAVRYFQRRRREAKDSPLFPFSNAEITRALRRADPHYTGHSIRRGALSYLVLVGKTEEEILRLKTHRTREGLASYIPLAQASLAKSTLSVSRLL